MGWACRPADRLWAVPRTVDPTPMEDQAALQYQCRRPGRRIGLAGRSRLSYGEGRAGSGRARADLPVPQRYVRSTCISQPGEFLALPPAAWRRGSTQGRLDAAWYLGALLQQARVDRLH